MSALGHARHALAVVLSVTGLLAPGAAHATAFRPRFEPTDLELENPGNVELDLQFGPTTGDDGNGRFFAPDYELDLGLLPRLELDVDGALSVEPLAGSRARLAVGEPLWTSAKIGLADVRDLGPARTAAVGLQLGPRLPITSDLHGAGYEALALVGVTVAGAQLVLNGGGLVDPASADTKRRPYGVLAGVDVQLDLDDEQRWQLLGEIGGAYYFAEAPKQLNFTAGIGWSSGPVQLSLIGLATPIGAADRFGLLAGVSPKIAVF